MAAIASRNSLSCLQCREQLAALLRGDDARQLAARLLLQLIELISLLLG